MTLRAGRGTAAGTAGCGHGLEGLRAEGTEWSHQGNPGSVRKSKRDGSEQSRAGGECPGEACAAAVICRGALDRRAPQSEGAQGADGKSCSAEQTEDVSDEQLPAALAGQRQPHRGIGSRALHQRRARRVPRKPLSRQPEVQSRREERPGAGRSETGPEGKLAGASPGLQGSPELPGVLLTDTQ